MKNPEAIGLLLPARAGLFKESYSGFVKRMSALRVPILGVGCERHPRDLRGGYLRKERVRESGTGQAQGGLRQEQKDVSARERVRDDELIRNASSCVG